MTNIQPFPFLRLPRELRDLVYHFALSFPENRSTDINGYTHYKIHPVWLRLSHQINQEAQQVLRRNIFVSISTPWPQAYRHVGADGFVPLLAVDKAAEEFKSYHLDVQISSPGIPDVMSSLERFIIHIDDLKTFCDFWFYQDLSYQGLNTHLDLKLILKDPYAPAWEDRTITKALQKRLLEPFGVIRGLQGWKIVGEHYDSIEKTIKEKMEEPLRSPEECLAECERLKEQGNELLKKKSYQEAIKKYEEAFFAMHILVIGRRRSVWADIYFDSDLRSGPFKGQSGRIVRIMLRLKLVANVVFAYLNLEEWREAEFWGMRTISLLGDVSPEEQGGFPANKEIGKIYYRTAKACKELKDKESALRYFKTAMAFLPSDRKQIETDISALSS